MEGNQKTEITSLTNQIPKEIDGRKTLIEESKGRKVAEQI